jgi:hypothetical protein
MTLKAAEPARRGSAGAAGRQIPAMASRARPISEPCGGADSALPAHSVGARLGTGETIGRPGRASGGVLFRQIAVGRTVIPDPGRKVERGAYFCLTIANG